MEELVSVVVTTHKREPKLVSRALDSVVRQTYSSIEIIVVDDSPSDFIYRSAVEELCLGLRNTISIKYYQNESNRGACFSRNFGISKASGSIIAFLDDDDEWLPEKVEKQRALMESAGSDLVSCAFIIVNEASGLTTIENNVDDNKNPIAGLLCRNYIGSVSFVLLKKHCFDGAGLFDEDMPACQDQDMWIRVALHYSLSYVSEPLVRYHVHDGDQITKNPEKRYAALSRLLSKYGKLYDDNKRCKAQLYTDLALAGIQCDKRRTSLSYYVRSILLNSSTALPPLGRFVRGYLASLRRAVRTIGANSSC